MTSKRYNTRVERLSSRWLLKTPVVIAIIAAVSLLIYGQSLGNQFLQWDEGQLITDNPIVLSSFPGNVEKAFTSYDPELYIPLTFVSFQAEHAIAGLNPFLFHLDNLLLHLLCAILVFFLLQKFGISRLAAFMGALLFAAHPVNVETVAWVSARKDLLATAFSLLCILSYFRFRESEWKKWLWISLVLFFAALLCKISAIAVPFLLLLIGWKDDRRIGKKQLFTLAPFFLLGILLGIVGIAGKTRNVAALSLPSTILLSIKSTMFSLLLFFLPFRLSALYLQPMPIHLGDPTVAASILAFIVLAAIAGLSLTRGKQLTFGLLFFLLALLPSFASFVKNGDAYVTADHYLYLPVIGLIYLVCVALDLARTRAARDWFLWVPAAFIFCLAAFTAHAQTAIWHDSATLFLDSLHKNPRSASMFYNLGLLEQTNGNLAAAESDYHAALTLNPRYPKAYVNLGMIADTEGQRQQAIDEYERALSIDPRNPDAHNDIGSILLAAGQTDAAIAQFQAALDADPRFAQAYVNLGYAYGKKGMYEQGLAAFQKAFELNPGSEADAAKIKQVLEGLQKQ